MAMPSFNLVALIFVTLHTGTFGESVKSQILRVLVEGRPSPYAPPFPPAPGPPVMWSHQNVWMLNACSTSK